MPDDDRIPWQVTGPWRRVMRSLQRRDSAERVAQATVKALAETLRATGGVPQLPAICSSMRSWASNGEPDLAETLARRGAGRHVPSGIAWRSAVALAASRPEELRDASVDEVAQMLAQQVLPDLADHYCFDRIGPDLVAEGRYEPDELRDLVNSVRMSEPVAKLAERLVARPDARGLRAPNSRIPRVGLADLLDADLERVHL